MKSPISTYAHLRVLVGFLGEKTQANWWPTSFFSSSSRSFLEPVFSRSIRLAQYHGVVESARYLHDGYLTQGRLGLFRLSEEIEQDLHRLINQDPDQWFAEVGSREQAIAALSEIADGSGAIASGPQCIGTRAQLLSQDGPKLLARSYASAFEQNIQCFPYFAD